MGCEENAFCSSLSDEVRRELCKGCARRVISAGSVQCFFDFQDDVVLVLDGLITGTTQFESEERDRYLPRFSHLGPGRFYGSRKLFDVPYDALFNHSFLTYLTDCCVALFKQDFIDELWERYPSFSEAAVRSQSRWIIDASELAAIFRIPSSYQQVVELVRFLSLRGLYLTERAIAETLACNRTTVSRAFAQMSEEYPSLLQAFSGFKAHKVKLLNPACA